MTTKLLRTLMGMVALVAMLTACSSEDVILDEPNAKNEITFNVTTNRASRAVQIFDSKNLPGEFYLNAWLYTNKSDLTVGKLYIDRDTVVNANPQSTPSWINKNGTRYWPGKGEYLDFYAYAGQGLGREKTSDGVTSYESPKFNTYDDADNVDGRPELRGFYQRPHAEDQTDLIYATSFELRKQGEISTPVPLTFKHALTQVVFDAKTVSNKLYIEIAEVGFVNVQDHGAFVFPTKGQSQGKWSIDTEDCHNVSYSNFDVNKNDDEIEVVKIVGKDKLIPLTYGYSNLSKDQPAAEGTDEITGNYASQDEKNSRALLMLPVDYKLGEVGSTPIKSEYYGVPVEWEGTFIRVKCAIWNIAHPTTTAPLYGFNPNTDVMIYGDSTTKYAYIYIPVETKWETDNMMGKRIIYTLSFGTGNAGVDSNGEKVIEGVTYNVNVEEWDNGDTQTPTDINSTIEG